MSKKYASIDKEQKEKTDAMLTATNLCKTVEEKIDKDELNNCTEDEKEEIKSAVSNVREIISDNTASSESIKESLDQLQKLLEGKLT